MASCSRFLMILWLGVVARAQSSSSSGSKWPIAAWVGFALGLATICLLVAIVLARLDYYLCTKARLRPRIPRPSGPYPRLHPDVTRPRPYPGMAVPAHGSSATSSTSDTLPTSEVGYGRYQSPTQWYGSTMRSGGYDRPPPGLGPVRGPSMRSISSSKMSTMSSDHAGIVTTASATYEMYLAKGSPSNDKRIYVPPAMPRPVHLKHYETVKHAKQPQLRIETRRASEHSPPIPSPLSTHPSIIACDAV
ncbi:hypothetical protein JAAARDRAFT_200362 [Jaapia argillacea MUCL 33604]|uniref:Uncharacterized protein n=1 Tax=Jaapia argillacea MUCL 33604 TaxID=933084 RepID=A0A067PHU5_9AGAM|nr:hypothetical protein JAAARDRAFT_200362 [Jaapia argillacea MUCL 33604]